MNMNVQQGNASNAFTKALESVDNISAELGKQCREELGAKLGFTTRAALGRRKNGFVNHTPIEREAIEKVFEKYGVTNCWDA